MSITFLLCLKEKFYFVVDADVSPKGPRIKRIWSGREREREKHRKQIVNDGMIKYFLANAALTDAPIYFNCTVRGSYRKSETVNIEYERVFDSRIVAIA